MKNLISLLLLFALAISAKGQQQQAEHILLQALELMQKHAVNSDSVDWKQMRQTALQIGRSKTPFDLGSAIRHAFAGLGDFHGALYHGDSSYQWQHRPLQANSEIVQAWQKGTGIGTALFSDGTAYLRIPGMPYVNRQQCDLQAQALNDSLCKLLQAKPKGLVIDLRLNGGGAMYPMVLGLQQLLPKGVLGAYHGKKVEKWQISASHFAIENDTMASLQSPCNLTLTDLPLAFISSEITGSSAEYLLMAFADYPQKTLIGSETAGFITATAGFPIGEEAFLLLSTAYGADRQGNIYRHAFRPEIPMQAPDRFFELESDAKVQRARAWLTATR